MSKQLVLVGIQTN